MNKKWTRSIMSQKLGKCDTFTRRVAVSDMNMRGGHHGNPQPRPREEGKRTRHRGSGWEVVRGEELLNAGGTPLWLGFAFAELSSYLSKAKL